MIIGILTSICSAVKCTLDEITPHAIGRSILVQTASRRLDPALAARRWKMGRLEIYTEMFFAIPAATCPRIPASQMRNAQKLAFVGQNLRGAELAPNAGMVASCMTSDRKVRDLRGSHQARKRKRILWVLPPASQKLVPGCTLVVELHNLHRLACCIMTGHPFQSIQERVLLFQATVSLGPHEPWCEERELPRISLPLGRSFHRSLT